MHRNQFYLLLGPFKFEQLNQNPEVALIHDFTPVENIQKIQNLAKGKMMSTPYTTNGKIKSFSKFRTSKGKTWLSLTLENPWPLNDLENPLASPAMQEIGIRNNI